ncbi:MAG: hypothetical protein AABW59_02850 [archaeon]
MKFIEFLKGLFRPKASSGAQGVAQDVSEAKNSEIYPKEAEKGQSEITSVWDILQFNDNTQAFHLSNVIRFDEWVTMDEIRRRIIEVFQIDYKNERSLYPYLKTFVDIGLIETNSVGGKRKWRKKDLLVKINIKNPEKEETRVAQTA